MNQDELLDVKDIERELERFVRRQFARADLGEASLQYIAFDEDANEIAMTEVAERLAARGLSTIEPGETHYAQMVIDGPPRGSGAVDAIFTLQTNDWEFHAEAAGRERGREPHHYKQQRLTVTTATHRFVRGLKTSSLELVTSEERAS